MRTSINISCWLPSMWKLTFVAEDLRNDARIVKNKCHSLCPIKCHQKLFPSIRFLEYITSPHTENLQITNIKIIASVDSRVYTVGLFFLYKNSVPKSQARVFLFFCLFNTEIYLWPFLDYREKYALPFHLHKFYCILQVVNMQKYILKTSQPRVNSYHILKISKVLASMLSCKKKDHELKKELPLKLGFNGAFYSTMQILQV